jgi:hypothetical protein
MFLFLVEVGSEHATNETTATKGLTAFEAARQPGRAEQTPSRLLKLDRRRFENSIDASQPRGNSL